MKRRHVVLAAALTITVTLAAGPAPAAPRTLGEGLLAFHEEAGRAVGLVTDQLRDLAQKIDDHLAQAARPGGPPGPPSRPAERPLITFMLDHRQDLGLTPDQVARLETLRDEFAREAVRRDADVRIAEMDLQAALQKEPVDLARAEAKIKESAQLRADLRLARLKAIEQGKAVLTAEQRTRLDGLVSQPPPGPGGRRFGGPEGPGGPGRRL